jgi:hypothetical protein
VLRGEHLAPRTAPCTSGWRSRPRRASNSRRPRPRAPA